MLSTVVNEANFVDIVVVVVVHVANVVAVQGRGSHPVIQSQMSLSYHVWWFVKYEKKSMKKIDEKKSQFVEFGFITIFFENYK